MSRMKGWLSKAIDTQNEKELEACIIGLFNQTSSIDKFLYPLIVAMMQETWHHQHEDIVNLIYLKDLKDDRFVNPVVKIAEEEGVYRIYDDELESTLRKCVHVLKMIDSEASKKALAKLIETGNENIKYALGI